MTDAHQEALREFLAEARAGLGSLAAALDAAPSSPPDLARLQRVAHTIQGAAGFFAFGRVERLGRAVEEALAARRATEAPLDDEAAGALRAATAALSALLEGAEATGREAPAADEAALAGLEGLRRGAGAPAGGRTT